jgi:membrane protease YdiL (CAAX protease family)
LNLLILILNKVSLITNTIIQIYLLAFIIFIYMLNPNKKSKLFKVYKKHFKITFVLCLIILVFQVFSFKFIYPRLYLNLNFDFSNVLFNLVILQLLNCVSEEMFFRGYIFSLLDKNYSNKESLFISTLTFIIYHIIIFNVTSANEGLMIIIFTGSVGLCLGYIYIKTENLISCVLIHMVYNLSQNIISIEFNVFNLEFQNIYIQFIYPSLIFTTISIVYIIYNKLKFKEEKMDNSNDDSFYI